MNMKKLLTTFLSLFLIVGMLAGCSASVSAAPIPSQTPAQAAAPAGNTHPSSFDDGSAVVTVSGVDELLAAIAPDTSIALAAGTYDLSTASTYGGDTGNPYTRWEPVYDEERGESYELVITGTDHLSLRGAGMDSVTIAAIPRYANVLHFVGCSGLTVSRLTAGHTEAPGWCAGGVLWLEDCSDADVSFCGLFGCGTVGVQADRCRNVGVRACRIYDCSQYAVCVRACRDFRVIGCDITDNGDDDGSAFALFAADTSDGFLVADCRISGNIAQVVLDSTYSRNVRFLSNLVEENLILSSVFSLEQYAAVVDGCRFALNMFPETVPFTWHNESGLCTVGPDGGELSPYELKTMTYVPYDPDQAPAPADAAAPVDIPAGGEVTVSTADEFLAAIGPDRTIVIDTELLDLSTASDFGVLGGEYYFWRDWYDGPELVIHDVQNLIIRAAGDDPASCTVAAVPRYANVLAFLECSGVRVSGLTAGHTDGQGSCTGGVLLFENCSGIVVDRCRLYGCGILGIEASYCSELKVTDCEIYDCTQGGLRLYATERAAFTDCDIHDVAGTAVTLTDCADILWNGIFLPNGWYDLENSVPVPVPAWY